jgi:hypothetical protein
MKGGSDLKNPRVLGRVELKTIRPGVVVAKEEVDTISILQAILACDFVEDYLLPRLWWRRPRKPRRVIKDVIDDIRHELLGDLVERKEIVEKVLARGRAELLRNVKSDTRGGRVSTASSINPKSVKTTTGR